MKVFLNDDFILFLILFSTRVKAEKIARILNDFIFEKSKWDKILLNLKILIFSETEQNPVLRNRYRCSFAVSKETE